MENENIDTGSEGTENQTGLEQTGTENQGGEHSEEQNTGTEETTGKTGKPKFTDKNMQAQFTKRMTEFKQKEKEWETKFSESEKDANLARTIRSNPGLVAAIKNYVEGLNKPQKKELPVIDNDTFLEATTNPVKFQKLLDERARLIAEQMISEKLPALEERLNANTAKFQDQERISAINSFAAEHEDFWTLDNDGKGPIEGYLRELQPFNMPMELKIKIAYDRAKAGSVDRQVKDKAHGIVEKKKAASTEKGGTDNSGYKKKDTRSVDQVLQDAANALKWV